MWYKDPLVGIVALLFIVALVGLFDFIKSSLREKSRKKLIHKLSDSYTIFDTQEGVKELLNLRSSSLGVLEFIAGSYVKSHHFQEAINVYSSILQNISNQDDKSRILGKLAQAYYQAGFLMRAKDITLGIIKNHPRLIDSLYLLLKINHALQDYKSNVEISECIIAIYEEQSYRRVDVDDELARMKEIYAYYRLVTLLQNDYVGIKKKTQIIESEFALNTKLERVILKFYKENNRTLFWQKIEEKQDIDNVLDIVWSCDDMLDTKNMVLIDMQKAKGLIESSEPCAKFEFEILRLLNVARIKGEDSNQAHKIFRANLKFLYRCSECKNTSPFDMENCPNCEAMLSLSPSGIVYEEDNNI